jgi:predicted RNA-binding Zn ribbon-like protein
LERAISVAASVANYATERRWTLGLLSNGVPRSDQPIKVLPGRSPDQLARVLEALAAVTSFAAGSIENILQVESPRIPLGATLVVVTAVENEELLATLIQLREAGRRIVLVSLADEEPPDDLPFLVYHLPAQVPTVWHRSSRGELSGTLAGIPVPEPVTTVTDR